MIKLLSLLTSVIVSNVGDTDPDTCIFSVFWPFRIKKDFFIFVKLYHLCIVLKSCTIPSFSSFSFGFLEICSDSFRIRKVPDHDLYNLKCSGSDQIRFTKLIVREQKLYFSEVSSSVVDP
jgi:hypothetical protein